MCSLSVSAKILISINTYTICEEEKEKSSLTSMLFYRYNINGIRITTITLDREISQNVIGLVGSKHLGPASMYKKIN